MKVNSFFKILNRKINMYDKLASNPFMENTRFVIVWIEDDTESKTLKDKSIK